MANTSHRTSPSPKNKPERLKATIKKLVSLGVPSQLAPTWPLTAHPTGRWCKKIKSVATTGGSPWKLWYFASIADGWESALTRYRDEIADILAGRVPTARKSGDTSDGLRLLDLCNKFLHFKRGLIPTN